MLKNFISKMLFCFETNLMVCSISLYELYILMQDDNKNVNKVHFLIYQNYRLLTHLLPDFMDNRKNIQNYISNRKLTCLLCVCVLQGSAPYQVHYWEVHVSVLASICRTWLLLIIYKTSSQNCSVTISGQVGHWFKGSTNFHLIDLYFEYL